MVGGERAHDKELKEKRQWKKKVSERRLQALANVLAKVDDEEGLMLKVNRIFVPLQVQSTRFFDLRELSPLFPFKVSHLLMFVQGNNFFAKSDLYCVLLIYNKLNETVLCVDH